MILASLNRRDIKLKRVVRVFISSPQNPFPHGILGPHGNRWNLREDAGSYMRPDNMRYSI
jgi:hypothetical protein